MLILWIIHGSIIGLFVLLGALLSQGKGAFLIAGYNTSSQEEKSKIDENALCKAVARMMFALAGSWAVAAAGTLLDRKSIFWLGMALFLAVITVGLIYMNTGHRFEKK